MGRIGLLLMAWSLTNDPLLMAIYSDYQTRQVREVDQEQVEEYGQSEVSDDSEHYSWDNLYLCDYCDTEIILNPYE